MNSPFNHFCLKDKAFLNWSSGKDSALSLFLALAEEKLSIDTLVTTVNESHDRVSMHGLRASFLQKQAEAIRLPLREIKLSESISMEKYSEIMEGEFQKLVDTGFTHAIYGDIFLEDLREFRQKSLQKVGLQGVYPLWKQDTATLARTIIALGFKAITIATSDKLLGKDFCGRDYNLDFLDSLPVGVDPCGENGEFHTFVYDGPIFKNPISFEIGERVKRDLNTSSTQNGDWESIFWFCDLI